MGDVLRGGGRAGTTLLSVVAVSWIGSSLRFLR